MKKLVSMAVAVAVLGLGVGFGAASNAANATGRCWGYCTPDDHLIMCCPGVGCWDTGQPCPF